MKIALITDSYASMDTDVAVHVGVLAEGLLRMGHRVLIAMPELGCDEAIQEGNLLRCDGKRSSTAEGVQVSRAGGRQLEDKLRAFRPELLHIHTLSETGKAALQYAANSEIPALLTVHSLRDLDKSGGGFSPWALWREKKRLETAETVLEQASGIAVLSDAMAQSLYQEGVQVIGQRFPTAIDTELFYPGSASQAQQQSLARSLSLEGKTVVVCSGCEDGSIYHFLEAWGRAFSESGSMRLLLLNREEQEDDLLSMIHSLHLSRQVILTGHLSREEMAACYALSCCYVCCAQTEELRLSAVEAAACGTPLLIRAGSGTATVVENKINGFLWSSETEALDLVRKFAKVQGPGRESLMKMVSGTVRTLTPQNQARAAEVFYQSLFA